MRGLVEFLAEGAFRDPCFSVRGVHPSEKSVTWTRQIRVNTERRFIDTVLAPKSHLVFNFRIGNHYE